MKNTLTLSICFVLGLGLYAQKAGNFMTAERSPSIQEINMASTYANFQNQVGSLWQSQPIGINQFREATGSTFQPIYFEVYPNPASKWLGCDFPAESNIQFIRILDVAGQVIASYNLWDRLFYIGHLPSGLYQIQVVQFDNYAHATAFYKR